MHTKLRSKVCGNTGSCVAPEPSPSVIVLFDVLFTSSALQVRRNLLFYYMISNIESLSTAKLNYLCLNCHLWERLGPTLALRELYLNTVTCPAVSISITPDRGRSRQSDILCERFGQPFALRTNLTFTGTVYRP